MVLYIYDDHIKMFKVFPMVLYIYDDHIKMFKQYLRSKNLRILDYLSLDQPFDSRRLRGLLKKPSSFLRFVMDPIPRFTGGGKAVPRSTLYIV